MARKKGRSGSGKQKRVKIGANISAPKKKARLSEDPTSTAKRQPVWVFSALDEHGPWGKNRLTEDAIWNEILPKIRSYETMTWADIERDRNRNHSVPVSSLISDAQRRIQELRIDVDELFRFRFNGMQRLWGIRDRERFKILWWDPGHEVCPSQLKNT